MHQDERKRQLYGFLKQVKDTRMDPYALQLLLILADHCQNDLKKEREFLIRLLAQPTLLDKLLNSNETKHILISLAHAAVTVDRAGLQRAILYRLNEHSHHFHNLALIAEEITKVELRFCYQGSDP